MNQEQQGDGHLQNFKSCRQPLNLVIPRSAAPRNLKAYAEAKSRSLVTLEPGLKNTYASTFLNSNFRVAVRPEKLACTRIEESGSAESSTSIFISASPAASVTTCV
jgi:hypothetical protein